MKIRNPCAKITYRNQDYYEGTGSNGQNVSGGGQNHPEWRQSVELGIRSMNDELMVEIVDKDTLSEIVIG